MASRARVATARDPDGCGRVHAGVLAEPAAPLIIRRLGEIFDPALAGHCGNAGLRRVIETCLAGLAADRQRIDRIKTSLLSVQMEITVRRRLAVPGSN